MKSSPCGLVPGPGPSKLCRPFRWHALEPGQSIIHPCAGIQHNTPPGCTWVDAVLSGRSQPFKVRYRALKLSPCRPMPSLRRGSPWTSH
eukprot:9259127-Karenia_brevis.AAC.1